MLYRNYALNAATHPPLPPPASSRFLLLICLFEYFMGKKLYYSSLYLVFPRLISKFTDRNYDLHNNYIIMVFLTKTKLVQHLAVPHF